MSDQSTYELLWNRVLAKTRKTDGCWDFEGPRSHGYGSVAYGGKHCSAHRISYNFHNNTEASTQLEVMHLCENRRCVRPSHLKLGTRSENVQYSYDTGTHVARRHTQAITNDNVAKIKLLIRAGNLSRRELGAMFSVSHATINKIANGTRYKDINEELL